MRGRREGREGREGEGGLRGQGGCWRQADGRSDGRREVARVLVG